MAALFTLRHPLIVQGFMRLHERDVIACEQPLELVFRERKDRLGDLARPGKARRLQALDPERKAGLVPIEDLHAVAPAVGEQKERAGQRRQAQGLLHARGKAVDPDPEVDGVAVQIHGLRVYEHAHGNQASKAARRAATHAGGTEDDNVIETWPMVSVTVSAARSIGAGAPRGVTVTGTKAAGARQAYPFAPGGSPNARGVPGCADRSTPTAVRGGHRSLARSPGLPRTRQRVLARPHCFGSSPPTHLHQCDGSERKRLRASGAGCSCWSAYTTTAKGLKVTCRLDRRKYPTGRDVTDEEMQRVNLERNKSHGEWNYAIKPSVNA